MRTLLAVVALAGLLPGMEGGTTKETPRRYTPDDLYEYIDGAADGFVEADFRELVTQVYDASGGRSLTVDLFRHADPACAFGIYSQERPRQGSFVPVGAEGYHETGILNFWKGDLYVKLSAFGLGEGDRKLLLEVARGIESRIPGDSKPPKLLEAFPAEGKVARSERYLRRNVLGYPFLERAYTADYTVSGKKVSLWLFASGEASARPMLAEYLKAQGIAKLPAPGTPLAVKDAHQGPVLVLFTGKSFVIALGEGASAAGPLLEKVRKELGHLSS